MPTNALESLLANEATFRLDGVAAILRATAMECDLDLGLDRSEYVKVAVAAGYNKGTVASCWSYMRRSK